MSTEPQPALDLAKPLILRCGASLSNRLAKSATSEGLGDRSQAPTPALARLYRRWSESGAGLAITGNVLIDRRADGRGGGFHRRGDPGSTRISAQPVPLPADQSAHR